MTIQAKIFPRFSPIHAGMWLAALAGALLLLAPPGAAAAENRYPQEKQVTQVLDSRFQHNRYYPARGALVHNLPQAAAPIRFRDSTYYLHGGTWYRPSAGAGFRVIGPPAGVRVRFLPGFYTTVWLGDMPYYYANNVYYQWLPDQREYIVATPPDEAALSTQAPDASNADEPFIYPKNGQGEQQQATDRYECHKWASDQNGYDPTQPAGSLAADQIADKRGGYFRALTACLEGRGYSVA